MLAQPVPRVLQRSLRYSDSRQAAMTLYFRDVTREMEVDRMKSEFLSTAAHELRTPLASIMGFSELLMMREYDEKRRRDMLETMHRQSKRLTNLLNELLDLARIEARQGKDFKRERQPLGKLLSEVLAAFLMPDDPRVVEADLPADLPEVDVDRAKLQQALLNVLSNAYKYSPQGGIVRLDTVEGRRHGQRVVGIRVIDQGMGMTPEQLGHLFERFWRADTTGHIPGTGLGMALVKEILELHGGAVDVASEYGKGTTITLWLPMAAEEELALAA
jgi:signal transduction histidine kinase